MSNLIQIGIFDPLFYAARMDAAATGKYLTQWIKEKAPLSQRSKITAATVHSWLETPNTPPKLVLDAMVAYIRAHPPTVNDFSCNEGRGDATGWIELEVDFQVIKLEYTLQNRYHVSMLIGIFLANLGNINFDDVILNGAETVFET